MNVLVKFSHRCLLGMVVALTLLVSPAAAMWQVSGASDATLAPCSDCHVCPNPTTQEPCLKICVREGKPSDAIHTAAEGPEVAVLGQLEYMYKPVEFNHKLHAVMVGMGEGCATCHHFSPAGKFPPCSDCHGTAPSEDQNLRKPGLKGAYHRQCMGCHREWSHDTQCLVCHAPSDEIAAAAGVVDSTDILGIAHPIITEPVSKIYHTPHDDGPVVTFHHREHIVLFELRCTDCHQRENCGFCHDLQKPASLAKSMEEVHAICNDCHQEDRCDKCHGDREKPPFSHDMTGWALTRPHRGLDCHACHPTGRRLSKLNSNCNSCHGGWNPENFDHSRTGLVLDETHRELDCVDCHRERRFAVAPACADCHDDNRTPDVQPPGRWLPWPSE